MNKNRTVLHVHWEHCFDAVPKMADMMTVLLEKNITIVAVSDHGSIAAYRDVYDEINDTAHHEKYNIKVIYAVEAYVVVNDYSDIPMHLIIMAKNNYGKKAIDKAVYESNAHINGQDMPLMSFETIKRWFGKDGIGYGNVIITTACIQGPFGVSLIKNNRFMKKIEKAEIEIAKGIESGELEKPDSKDILELKAVVENLNNANTKLSEEKKELQKIAAKKTGKIERQLSKATAINAIDQMNDFKKQIEEVQVDAKKAIEKIAQINTSIEANKRAIKQKKEEMAAIEKKVSKYLSKCATINNLKEDLIDADEILERSKENVMFFFNTIYKGDFYAEIQYHGLSVEKEIYTNLIAFAKEVGIPLVAANDSHMASNSASDINARKVAKFLRYGSLFDDETEENENADKELYLKSPEELGEFLLKVYPKEVVDEALENAEKIGEQCNYIPPEKPKHYPVFDKNVNAKEEIVKLAYKGIDLRFPNKKGWTDEYQKRLEYELRVINEMGYADYHLITKFILDYARELGKVPKDRINEAPLDLDELKKWCEENKWDVGIGVGYGRGSAAGSLVCFLLGITSVDPIKYGLMFERFLNPERVTMPDIDSDFKIDIRDKTVEFVTKKFGDKAVCNILTKSYQQVKGAIRDAARYYGAVRARERGEEDEGEFLALGNAIRKKVPSLLNLAFDTTMDKVDNRKETTETFYEFLYASYSDNANAKEIIKLAKDIEGSFSGYGMHAAGVIISDNDDLTDYIPLRFNSKKSRWTTQCDMVQSENAGLLKMDLLNLKNLNVITEAVMMIKRNKGISVDINNIPFEKEVFDKIYSIGNTVGIFQMESPGITNFCKQLHPDNIFDTILINAMYRPGPMDFIPEVVAVKKGNKKAEYVTPELKPILESTYAGIVYQEQVMAICQQLAGYTLGQSDTVRRYMSKKKEDMLKLEREAFVNGDEKRGIKGCVSNGISTKAANIIFDQMIKFAKYAFNKSHAAAYAILSYMTAWLKFHYPSEYHCALLIYTDKAEKYLPIINSARNMGVEVLPPDINRSEAEFSVQNDKIMFGFNSIKTIGSIGDTIFEKRKEGAFTSYEDFALRTNIGQSKIETLVDAGCFDSLKYTRTSLKSVAIVDVFAQIKIVRDKQKFIIAAEKVIDLLEKNEYADVDIFKDAIKDADISYQVTSKNVPTVSSIKKRISSAQDAIAIALDELKDIQIPYIKDDKLLILENEKKALGLYLSGHPIDRFAVTTDDIQNTDLNTIALTGVIEDVVMHVNKSKRDWATLSISDRTGVIKVNVFAANYAKYKDFLNEGSVVIVKGKTGVDDFLSNDDETVYSMNANEVVPLRSVPEQYTITFQNEADYFFGNERKILEKDELGIEVSAYFVQEAKFRKINGLFSKESVINARGIKNE